MVSSVLRKSPQCVLPDLSPSQLPIVGSVSFHHLIIFIGTICAALGVIVSFAHILNHAFRAYRITEQKYLMRVQLVIPAFAIVATVGEWYYPANQYINPFPEVVEAFALVSLFQLFVQEAAGSTDPHEQEVYFAQLPRYRRKKLHQLFKSNTPNVLRHEKGSLRWYRVICMCLYQFPVVKAIWAIISLLLTAAICPTGKGGRGVKLLNGLVNSITTTTALWAIIIFYSRLRDILKPRHAFRKAFVLKKMIGIVLLQALIINFIEAGGAIVPTLQMSYGDYTVGVPTFMTQCEMFLFAIGFIYCYNVAEYRNIHREDQEAGLLGKTNGSPKRGKVSFLRAIWAMINISDLVRAMWRSTGHFFHFGRKVYVPVGISAAKEFSPASSLSGSAPLNAPMVVSPQPLPAQAAYAAPPYGYDGQALTPLAGPIDARGHPLYGQPPFAGQRTEYFH